ncbi:MAG: hypothetical protein QNJ55_24780 [Xenococcus sp. MO_188.B8]|nr:hypothetical protein [Xenococcus sp. MO_188.B8]
MKLVFYHWEVRSPVGKSGRSLCQTENENHNHEDEIALSLS